MLLKIAGLLFLVVVTSARPKELKGVGAEAANRSDLKRRQQMHRMQQHNYHPLGSNHESSTKTTTTTTTTQGQDRGSQRGIPRGVAGETPVSNTDTGEAPIYADRKQMKEHHMCVQGQCRTTTTTTTTPATTTQKGEESVAEVEEGKRPGQDRGSQHGIPRGVAGETPVSNTDTGESIPDEDYTRTDLKWKADVDEEPFEPYPVVLPYPHVLPLVKTSDPSAVWQEYKYCDRNKLRMVRFARSYWQWLDNTHLNQKGLTELEFRCEVPRGTQDCMTDEHKSKHDCILIRNGVYTTGANKMEEEKCPHNRQFITGLNATFGGPSLGITSLSIICDVPNWAATPEGKRNEPKPQSVRLQMTIPAFAPQASIDNGWEIGKDYECPEKTAVCGFKTKTVNSNFGSGINEIMIACCTFPADAYEDVSESESESEGGFKQEN